MLVFELFLTKSPTITRDSKASKLNQDGELTTFTDHLCIALLCYSDEIFFATTKTNTSLFFFTPFTCENTPIESSKHIPLGELLKSSRSRTFSAIEKFETGSCCGGKNNKRPERRSTRKKRGCFHALPNFR